MTFAHPRTMALADPALPAVAALLGEDPPPALQAVVEEVGGEIRSVRLTQVSWSPGRAITTRYQVEVRGGALDGSRTFMAAAGRIPEGAMTVESPNGTRIGVWVYPNDPALPGLASALDSRTAGEMLGQLGAGSEPVSTRLRAYRPTRRAVVEASRDRTRVFLKVVRPTAIEGLHRIHRTLSGVLPVPRSLGFDDRLGIVALEAMPGITLRETLAHEDTSLPDPRAVTGMVAALPGNDEMAVTTSPLERVPRMSRLIGAIAPELSGRLEDLVVALGGDPEPADRTVHGDYYEAQLTVADGRLVGVLDVDTYGLGRAADDAATMLGHLSVWGPVSPQPERVRGYANELLHIWDSELDPADLRRRAGAVVLSLATGPFRVQTATWPVEVTERVRIAERWAEGARRVDEKSLIPFSE